MLSKKKRLTKKIFQDIMEHGRSYTSPFFVFKYIPNTIPCFAVVAPKSVAKTAIDRNKLRRKGYNQLRTLSLPRGAGIFFYKKGTSQISTEDIKNDIQSIIKKVYKIN